MAQTAPRDIGNRGCRGRQLIVVISYVLRLAQIGVNILVDPHEAELYPIVQFDLGGIGVYLILEDGQVDLFCLVICIR